MYFKQNFDYYLFNITICTSTCIVFYSMYIFFEIVFVNVQYIAWLCRSICLEKIMIFLSQNSKLVNFVSLSLKPL